MSNGLEYIIIAVIVGAAVLFLTRGLWNKSAGCGKSGCGCSKTPKSHSKQ